MAKVTYCNTEKPKLVWYLAVAGAAIVLIMGTLVAVGVIAVLPFFYFSWFLIYVFLMTADYLLRKVTVDDEADTLVTNANKKYPMRISNISYIKYKTNKKGKFKSLFIHDNGVKFLDIRTKKVNADAIVAQLLEDNPSIDLQYVTNHI